MRVYIYFLVSDFNFLMIFVDVKGHSRNLFKLGEPDMQDIAGEAEMNS